MVSIREATAEDSHCVLGCLSAAFEEYRHHYTASAFADTVLTAETIVKRFQQMTVYVAVEESGEIVGTIACGVVNAEEGHIRGMAVHPTLQGTGIASRLLKRAESYFQERHCKRITLDTTAPLKRAIRVYERAGFRSTGRIHNFLGMPLHEYDKVI